MDLEIEPKHGIRGLPLGAPKDAVRRFFGTEPKVFQRTPTDNPSDHWADVGAFAYYRADNTLEALEFASPAELKLNGDSLTSMAMEEAVAFLSSIDPEITVSEAGASARSERLGISLWCPTPDLSGAKIEAALVFGDGYYD